jgi:hypothetical protein
LRAINPVLIAVFVVLIVAFLFFVISRVAGARRPQAPAAREEVPITLLPKTSLGRCSLGLAVAFIVLFVVAVVPLRGQWGFHENEGLVNPALTVILAIILVGISIAALVTGLVGAIKRRERGLFLSSWVC